MTEADPMPGLFIGMHSARAHTETLIFRRDVVKDQALMIIYRQT